MVLEDFAQKNQNIVMKKGARTVILDTKWKSLIDNERKIMVFHNRICIRCMHTRKNIIRLKYGCYIR